MGGKTNYFKFLFENPLLKRLILKDEILEDELFGSIEHDGIVPLESQIGSRIENINSIPLSTPSFHGYNSKMLIVKLAKIVNNIFGKAIPTRILEMSMKINEEIPICESLEFIEIINRIISKEKLRVSNY